MVYQLAAPAVQKVKVPAVPHGWGGVVTNDWCIIMVGFKFLPTFVSIRISNLTMGYRSML